MGPTPPQPPPPHTEDTRVAQLPLPGSAEEYVRDSIHASLGLPVSDRSLRLKLLASEDQRHRLQDHVFSLEEDLRAAQRRIDLLKVHKSQRTLSALPRSLLIRHPLPLLPQAEAAMNATGLRRCVEEKEAMAAAYADLSDKSSKECRLYERDLERAMESCDDLARENDDLRARLNQNADVSFLLSFFPFLIPDFLTTGALLKIRAFHCLVVFKI